MDAILDALAEARATKGQPTMILARTFKGKGISFVEDKDGWHGKALKKGEETGPARSRSSRRSSCPQPPIEGLAAHPEAGAAGAPRPPTPTLPAPAYKLGDRSPRAKRTAPRSPRSARPIRALSCSMPTWGTPRSASSSRRRSRTASIENYIAEQVMVGAAMGLAARGAIPFPSTFACFLTRAYDFIRMAAISNLNVKLAGSHAGVSIGEDGPSQMALEDLAMMRAEPNIDGALSVRRA